MIFKKKQTYQQHDNESGSFYKSSIKPFKNGEVLENNLNIDICVIGGGLTGISTALHLAQEGYSVALFEARKLGSGASGRRRRSWHWYRGACSAEHRDAGWWRLLRGAQYPWPREAAGGSFL